MITKGLNALFSLIKQTKQFYKMQDENNHISLNSFVKSLNF